jgi:hypothetical protein
MVNKFFVHQLLALMDLHWEPVPIFSGTLRSTVVFQFGFYQTITVNLVCPENEFLNETIYRKGF